MIKGRCTYTKQLNQDPGFAHNLEMSYLCNSNQQHFVDFFVPIRELIQIYI